MTIDFTSIPDATPVSTGNLYGGILYLEAMTGYRWATGVVTGGALAVEPPQTPNPTGEYQSHLTGVFLRHVTAVTLVVKCYRNSACSYQGVDSHGVGFNTRGQVIPGSIDGNPPPTGWVNVPLTIPAGGHLVSFQINNRDPKALDAAFYLKSISFTAPPLPPGNLRILGARKV